jgi:3',5'-cyclic-AMP phosphodiesterase
MAIADRDGCKGFCSMEDFFLLAHLSDPHVGAGDDWTAAFERAVAAVAAFEPAPDALLLTGDLANDGAPEQYALVRDLVDPLPMPVHVLPGNHDDPDALADAFGTRAPYAADCGPLRLLALDTTVEGSDAGGFGFERLAWLAERLAEEPGRPAIVAMHHPPIATGVRAFDELAVAPADIGPLEELLARHPEVRRVVAGHVHRAAVGELGGRSVFLCPGTHLQGKLDLARGELALVPEPPAFALHAWLGGRLVSHVQPVSGAIASA